MSTTQSLKMEKASLEDLPALTALWFDAFKTPYIRRLWPDTPGVRKWWDNAHRHDLINKPFQHYMKVVDPAVEDETGRSRIVAWAKWDLAMPEERGRRFPPWHEDMPGEEVDAMIEKVEAERRRVMGDQKHYFLDTLGTHPDYQRRGAGLMLLKWGCDLADQKGVGAYVDASKAGAPLYERFGFVDESKPDAGNIASMARR